MKRSLAALALVMAIGLQPQAARAQDNGWNALWLWLSHGQDPRLTGVGIGVGAATTAASYAATARHHGHVGNGVYAGAWAVTSYACAVVYPMVGTIVLNRPLTPREAYVGMADCVIPFIGGWIVDAALPHDAWTDGLPPPTARRH